jgi:hypothetical protein
VEKQSTPKGAKIPGNDSGLQPGHFLFPLWKTAFYAGSASAVFDVTQSRHLTL